MNPWKCFSIFNFNIINISTFNIKCVLLFFCSSFLYPLTKKGKKKKKGQTKTNISWHCNVACPISPSCHSPSPTVKKLPGITTSGHLWATTKFFWPSSVLPLHPAGSWGDFLLHCYLKHFPQNFFSPCLGFHRLG